MGIAGTSHMQLLLGSEALTRARGAGGAVHQHGEVSAARSEAARVDEAAVDGGGIHAHAGGRHVRDAGGRRVGDGRESDGISAVDRPGEVARTADLVVGDAKGGSDAVQVGRQGAAQSDGERAIACQQWAGGSSVGGVGVDPGRVGALSALALAVACTTRAPALTP